MRAADGCTDAVADAGGVSQLSDGRLDVRQWRDAFGRLWTVCEQWHAWQYVVRQ